MKSVFNHVTDLQLANLFWKDAMLSQVFFCEFFLVMFCVASSYRKSICNFEKLTNANRQQKLFEFWEAATRGLL